MKKVKKSQVRDLKFLKAARLRANTQAAVEKIDAEIAAYNIPAYKLTQNAELMRDLAEFLKHPAIRAVFKKK